MNLSWESMGKPKMWNVLKTAGRSAKWTKFGLVVLRCIYVGYSWYPNPWVWFGKLGSFSAIWENFRFYDFQNATSPTVFIGPHPNFMRTLLITGQCSLLLFLAIGQVLQNLWHFRILTLESMGKPEMWISKTADGRAKQTKIWDSGYYSKHMEVTFDAWFLEFGLGSFSTLCNISNFTIFKTLFHSQFHTANEKVQSST